MSLDPMQPVNMVRTADDVERFWRWLSSSDLVACDTETNLRSFYDYDFHIRLIQFGTVNEAWILDFQRWRGLIEDVFSRYQGEWIFHNSRFDVSALEREGVSVPWDRCHDTMIMLRLAEPREKAGLKEASSRHVSSVSADGQRILRDAFRIQDWNFASVPLDFPPYQFYAALDSILTSRLYHTDVARRGRESPVYDLEMEVRAVCTKMETNGLRIDTDLCQRRRDEMRDRADALKMAMFEKYGLHITSAQQLSHWFVSHSEAIPSMVKETAGGQLSVDKEVLLRLAMVPGDVSEVAVAALAVRRDEKITSAYLENFLESRDRFERIHPQIETIAARTGRMSVRDPALQTLPKPTIDSDYRVIREVVVPLQDDHVIVSCDYSQIELRLCAVVSEDPGMIDAFAMADGGDVDFFTSLARGVYRDEGLLKSDKRRSRVKAFCYSAVYGAGLNKMALTAGVPVAEMREVRDGIAARFPGFFRIGLTAAHQMKTNDGFVSTLFGRKLPVDVEYAAANYLIQGTAADVMKRALVNMAQAGLEPYMLMPVHDECIFSVPKEDAEEARHLIKTNMECLDFSVPLTADPSLGAATWADAEK